MPLFPVIVLAILQTTTPRADTPVVLENESLRVEFSARDGALTRLFNKPKQLELISTVPGSRQPWALLLAPAELVSEFVACRVVPPAAGRDHQVTLEWDTRHRISVHVTARLEPGSDQLELHCSAKNNGDRTVLALRYPAIQGIGPLSGDGTRDRLLHSTMMGALFFDPFHLFRGKSPIPAERGLTVSRYPNGFHGSSLQMMAYYTEGRGGFYIASHDPEGGDKDLNFYKAPDDRSLVCEVAHIQGDARPGKSLAVGYPVVIAALDRGDWYAAAERYRNWALSQPWCRRGTRRDRVDAGDSSRWLLEATGAVGAWWPFRNDIRADILRTRRFYGAPLMHLELWWSHGPSREAARSDGDRFGPFYFPFLALKGREAFKTHSRDAILPPWTPISPGWVAMCPAQPGWRNVVNESAEDMVGTQSQRHHQIWVDENKTGCAADCLYYDIGPCAGVPTGCYAPGHAHPPGAGGEVTRAYISLFEESSRRASRAKGAYVPVGTECVSEPFVGCLDFYYARNAGFNPDMETFPYIRDLSWLPDGRMEIVPLFPFVYHEHGPVAIQGIYPVDPWGVPAAEAFFAWAEARAVLWGSLIVTFPVPSHPEPSEARARYLRSLVGARTGFAREFLAYGRMQRHPEITCGTLTVDHGLAEGGWLRRIRFPRGGSVAQSPSSKRDRNEAHSKELSVEQWATGLVAIPFATPRSATLRVPAVLSQAYTLGNDRLAVLLVNLRSDGEEVVRLPVAPAAYGLPPGTYAITQDRAGEHRSLGVTSSRHEVVLTLVPRDVVVVTATRTGG
jgi:hypothetical protein